MDIFIHPSSSAYLRLWVQQLKEGTPTSLSPAPSSEAFTGRTVPPASSGSSQSDSWTTSADCIQSRDAASLPHPTSEFKCWPSFSTLHTQQRITCWRSCPEEANRTRSTSSTSYTTTWDPVHEHHIRDLWQGAATVESTGNCCGLRGFLWPGMERGLDSWRQVAVTWWMGEWVSSSNPEDLLMGADGGDAPEDNGGWCRFEGDPKQGEVWKQEPVWHGGHKEINQVAPNGCFTTS